MHECNVAFIHTHTQGYGRMRTQRRLHRHTLSRHTHTQREDHHYTAKLTLVGVSLSHTQVTLSSLREKPEEVEVYKGVTAPKRKRVEEQPAQLITEIPKVWDVCVCVYVCVCVCVCVCHTCVSHVCVCTVRAARQGGP